MAQADTTKAAARSWLRREQRAGVRAARPVLVLHVVGAVLAIGQAFAAATALAQAFAGAEVPIFALAAFGALALVRAVLSYMTEQAAFTAGASARRRLRSDALSSLLPAGP